MFFALTLIALGLVLLVAGGEALLRGAVGLATLLRLTPAVIGLTVVAAGTSVPELAVSAAAAWRGSVDIAVGNVVGSNIFNATLIVGLSALICPLRIRGNTIRLEYPVLAIATLLCVVLCRDGVVSRLDALLLVTAYVAFTAYMVRLVRQQITAAEAAELSAEVQELATPAVARRPWADALFILAGVVLLAGGAQATVSGAVGFARLLGMSDRMIGLTIVAGGTGLPEVVTSLVSSFRGRDDVALGNVIGSNLFNILGILGLGALVRPLPVAPGIVDSDLWWMLGVTLLLFPLLFTGRKVSRLEGVVLLAAYAVYLAQLLFREAGR